MEAASSTQVDFLSLRASSKRTTGSGGRLRAAGMGLTDMRNLLIVMMLLIPISGFAQSWKVTISKDEMSGGRNVRVCAMSLNTIQQGFPYNQGGTRARLCAYNKADELTVTLNISQGQIMCESLGSFVLKIDEQVAKSVDCEGTSDHDSEWGFFGTADESVKDFVQAKKVIRIQSTLYQSGSPIFRFPPMDRKSIEAIEAK